MIEYRVIDSDGIEAVKVSAPSDADAFAQAMHYAMVYAQDGRVTVERRVGKEWELVMIRSGRSERALQALADQAQELDMGYGDG